MNRKNIYTVVLLLVLPFLLLASCSGKKAVRAEVPEVEQLYKKAQRAFQISYYSEAETDLKTLMDTYPLTPEAFDAQLMLSDLYYLTEQYEDASAYYTTFYTFHPTHPRAAYALFQKGMSHFKMVLSIDRDMAATRKAYFAFQDLLHSYPESVYTDKAAQLSAFLRERLAERELLVGKYYFKNKNYKGALMRFGYILKDYPDTKLPPAALYYIGESYTLLGEDGRAREAYETLIKKFPESPYVSTVRNKLQDENGG